MKDAAAGYDTLLYDYGMSAGIYSALLWGKRRRMLRKLSELSAGTCLTPPVTASVRSVNRSSAYLSCVTVRMFSSKNCLREYEETDVTEAAKKIIAGIREAKQRYGINVIAGMLAGEERAKLREYGCSISSLEKGAFTHMSTRVLSEKMIYGGRFSSLARCVEKRDFRQGAGCGPVYGDADE